MADPLDPPTETPLPTRSWLSLGAVLVVQAHNAFNDNFAKLVLIPLTVVVAAGTPLALYIENIIGALFVLPFILFAPPAGWLSDRFPKSRVIQISLLAKLLIFGLFLYAISIRSLKLALIADFLFLLQSTLFSPAKYGILKEIVGSKRLGTANGLMQMLTMAGILAGMAIAGWWFDADLARRHEAQGVSPDNAWNTAFHLFAWGTAATAIPVLLGLLIQRTPEHPGKVFRPSILGSHFSDLAYLLRQPVLRRTALLISAYWFVAHFLGFAYIGFAKELYPDAEAGGVGESSARMLTITGLGLILGSLLVSFLSRQGNRLSLTVVGGLAMTAGLVVLGTLKVESLPWLGAVGWIGFFSGFLLVPLSAHLQDSIEPEHRGRVLSAQNLITSLAGIAAIFANVGMKNFGLPIATQTLVLAPGLLLVSFLILRLLQTSALLPPAKAA